MATFLVRVLRSADIQPQTATGDHFGDDDGSVHEAAINAAHAAGWATGRPDATFAPDGRLRRDQMGSLLRRMLGTLVADGRLTPPGA